MGERLTKSEIQNIYPDQWVLLTDIINNERTHDIESAIVAESNLDENYALSTQFRNSDYKAWYTTADKDPTIVCLGPITVEGIVS